MSFFLRNAHMVMPSKLLFLMTIVFGLGAGDRVHAVSIFATDSGFVTEVGGSAKGDGTLTPGATYNYSVGREVHYDIGAFSPTTVPMDRNNYFVFDLGGVSSPIVSASLEVYTGLYESVDPTETFDLVAPADPAAALSDIDFLLLSNLIGSTEFDEVTDPAISVAAALYGNLATGPPTPLGSAVISAADDGSILSIPIDPGYLNAFLGGPVVLGGSVSSVVPPGTPQQPFGLTGPDIPGGDPLTPALVFTLIPEPASLGLVTLGLLGVSGLRRRRRQF